ncbi:hypothetical protein C5N14_14840 [Micromonospora sp. MW-13]|uniref:hypothetical protein n=1 Tax=Micromonospora sp. MW-13 TaxID=2094022 RepID=UPI000E449168|nr:hypothetical protein [Micromonospora sp. MW-13]RGC68193.1 hypothetical protein C5N14_14840 [Micromonospora sp. MW-13]
MEPVRAESPNAPARRVLGIALAAMVAVAVLVGGLLIFRASVGDSGPPVGCAEAEQALARSNAADPADPAKWSRLATDLEAAAKKATDREVAAAIQAIADNNRRIAAFSTASEPRVDNALAQLEETKKYGTNLQTYMRVCAAEIYPNE